MGSPPNLNPPNILPIQEFADLVPSPSYSAGNETPVSRSQDGTSPLVGFHVRL